MQANHQQQMYNHQLLAVQQQQLQQQQQQLALAQQQLALGYGGFAPMQQQPPMNMGGRRAVSNATAVNNSTRPSGNYSEIFVGNLSFFCEESHVYELFNAYGNVEEVRIVRNDSNTRSLMFGFATMSSPAEAREMCKLLNGHLFMGRNLK